MLQAERSKIRSSLSFAFHAFGTCVVRVPGKILHARVALTAVHFPKTIASRSYRGSLLSLDLVR